jgi:hypothetical protein
LYPGAGVVGCSRGVRHLTEDGLIGCSLFTKVVSSTGRSPDVFIVPTNLTMSD